MSKKGGWRDIDAQSNESLTRFCSRDGTWEPSDVRMPFTAMIELEEDGEDGKPGDYEFRQRMIGVRAFFNFIRARGVTPMDMFRQLTAAARAMHVAPFDAMTMHEIAMMEGQSPAAHSWRCKVLSGEIELAGMKGSKLPGQKSKAASESYRKVRKGNNNRKGGKKAARVTKARQEAKRPGSFLTQLQAPKRPTQPQDQES